MTSQSFVTFYDLPHFHLPHPFTLTFTPHFANSHATSPQLFHIKSIPQPLLVNQKPLLIKKHSFFPQQLQFRGLILSTGRLFPIPLESPNKLHRDIKSQLLFSLTLSHTHTYTHIHSPLTSIYKISASKKRVELHTPVLAIQR